MTAALGYAVEALSPDCLRVSLHAYLPSGRHVVVLTCTRWIRPNTEQDVEYFGIGDGFLHVYLIPVRLLEGLGTISVDRYEAYRVRMPTPADLPPAP